METTIPSFIEIADEDQHIGDRNDIITGICQYAIAQNI
jgi:hypothetical protein